MSMAAINERRTELQSCPFHLIDGHLGIRNEYQRPIRWNVSPALFLNDFNNSQRTNPGEKAGNSCWLCIWLSFGSILIWMISFRFEIFELNWNISIELIFLKKINNLIDIFEFIIHLFLIKLIDFKCYLNDLNLIHFSFFLLNWSFWIKLNLFILNVI